MMGTHRVFIIGDSLFAETLTNLLEQREELSIVGASVSVEEVINEDLTLLPDVFIVAESNESYDQNLMTLFDKYPNIPVIRTGLNSNTLHFFSNRRLQARTAELVSAITSLPKRS